MRPIPEALGVLVEAPVMAHSIGADGRLLDVSEEWLRVLGYSREEVLGRRSVEFLSEASAEYARATVLPEFFRTGVCRQIPYDFVKRDGSLLPVLLSGVAIHDEAGEFQRSVAVLTDMSQDRLQSAQLKLAFDATKRRIWDWECRDGRWGWVATGELAFEGLREGARFEDYLALVHPDDRDRFEGALQKAVDEGSELSFAHRLAQGSRWLHVMAQVLVDASGESRRVVGSVRDVTERKQAEEEERRLRERAAQAQRLESLGVLAGGVAHDFNNLLVAVLGNADLALQELGRTHPVAGNLEAITTAARRASDLCQHLLTYAGKGWFEVQPVCLADLVREMVDLLEVSVGQRATLRLNLDAVPAVEADVVQLRQVVMNLITNASEAVERGGTISVRVAAVDCDAAELHAQFLDAELAPGRYVALEVTDDGCGMSEEAQARIFDPFYTTKFTGRGLGLAAVLGIVTAHGGAIRVSSQVGRGTTVKVVLPASATAVPERASARASGGGSARGLSGRLLVIDDQPEVLEVVEAMATALGMDVEVAVGGAEGLERYAACRADVIVLDLTMPDMDGHETFRRLRALDPDVKVVLSTGYSEQSVSGAFQAGELAGFIQKPYRMRVLEEALRRALSDEASS